MITEMCRTCWQPSLSLKNISAEPADVGWYVFFISMHLVRCLQILTCWLSQFMVRHSFISPLLLSCPCDIICDSRFHMQLLSELASKTHSKIQCKQKNWSFFNLPCAKTKNERAHEFRKITKVNTK